MLASTITTAEQLRSQMEVFQLQASFGEDVNRAEPLLKNSESKMQGEFWEMEVRKERRTDPNSQKPGRRQRRGE